MSHVGPDGVNHDFYEKRDYYEDKNLVRPYIVGMACSLCHVSFDPVRPPADVNNPKWENLNDYVGAQYFIMQVDSSDTETMELLAREIVPRVTMRG